MLYRMANDIRIRKCLFALITNNNDSYVILNINSRRDISGAVFSPEPGVNRTMEEEAFKLAIDQINNDTVNYPDFKLRGLIRFSDPNDDFDNIEQGEQLIIIVLVKLNGEA